MTTPHVRDEFDPLGIGPICREDQEDWPCPFVQGRAAALADAKAAVTAEIQRQVARFPMSTIELREAHFCLISAIDELETKP